MRLASLAFAAGLTACASAPSRVVTPLRYQEALGAPTPDDAFRASPPPPLDEVPLPRFAPQELTLSNGMRLLVVQRTGHATIAATVVFARDAAEIGDVGYERLSLVAPVYLASPDARYPVRASCDATGCSTGSQGALGTVDGILGDLASRIVSPSTPREDLVHKLETALSARERNSMRIADILGRNARVLLFRNTYYGVPDPPIPHPTLDELDRVRDAVISPANATLVVVGDLSVENARAAAEAHFGQWPARPAPTERPHPALPIIAVKPQIVLVGVSGLKQVQAYVVSRAPTATDPDVYPFFIAAMLVGNTVGSTAYAHVREEMAATYGLGALMGTSRDVGLLTIGGSFDVDKTIDGFESLLSGIRDLRAQEVSPAALASAKAAALGRWRARIETNRGVADLIGTHVLTGLPLNPTAYTDALARVTADDVHRVARHWLTESDLRVILLGDVHAIYRDLYKLGFREFGVSDQFGKDRLKR